MFSVPIKSLFIVFPQGKEKGREKGSACALQNDSKWERKYTQHSKINRQINTPQMGLPKTRGLVSHSLGKRGMDEGKNRQVHAFLPSLPINSRFHTKFWFLAVNMELHSSVSY